MVVTTILVVATLAYLGLVGAYWYGWSAIPEVFLHRKPSDKMVSVVIAARNEEATIGTCIRSLLEQDYPASLLEIIIVDDDSSDDTAAVIARFGDHRIQYIRMFAPSAEEKVISFKKRALAAGIAAAKGAWVITTDADCVCPPQWISTLAGQWESGNPVMLVAPVRFLNSGSVVEQFQQFDFMMMQGITAATRFWDWGVMCNGANLAFRKDAYLAVNGYSGVDHIVSGDDYLLMLKMKQQYPDQIHYVKSGSVAVDTLPQPDWRSFVQQRLRWASKSGKYADPAMTRALSLVFFFNFLLVFSLFFVNKEEYLLQVWGLCLIMKILIEVSFLRTIDTVYPIRASLWIFPLLQPLHIIYIILVGLFSRLGRFSWKDRSTIN